MHYTIAIVVLISLSSCVQKNCYVATYTIEKNNSVLRTKDICFRFMNNLADKNVLHKEDPYFITRTLSSNEEPYSGLTYWFNQKDTSILKVVFWSTSYKNNNFPFRNLLNEVSDSVQTNFTLADMVIMEKDRSEKNSKWLNLPTPK